MGVKGYKVFNQDWTCRDFKYEVRQTYTHDGPIAVCEAGFHFCQKPSACFNYYPFDSSNHVAEIEAIGNVMVKGDKSVTNKIHIIREIPWHEVLDLVNDGKNCTGLGNTGNNNAGNYNAGIRNTGDYNTGNYNTGDYNTGDYNTGNWNAGYCNAGYYNTGNYNIGDWNTGCYNTADYSIGFFNTVKSSVMAFNKPLEMDRRDFLMTKGMKLISIGLRPTVWIPSEHSSTGGYLKVNDFKTACRQMWDDFTDGERQAVREIPNFDADVFEEITGIDARE